MEDGSGGLILVQVLKAGTHPEKAGAYPRFVLENLGAEIVSGVVSAAHSELLKTAEEIPESGEMAKVRSDSPQSFGDLRRASPCLWFCHLAGP
jgi:hypothetical protein